MKLAKYLKEIQVPRIPEVTPETTLNMNLNSVLEWDIDDYNWVAIPKDRTFNEDCSLISYLDWVKFPALGITWEYFHWVNFNETTHDSKAIWDLMNFKIKDGTLGDLLFNLRNIKKLIDQFNTDPFELNYDRDTWFDRPEQRSIRCVTTPNIINNPKTFKIILDQLKVWNWELYYLNDDRTNMNIYPN